MRLYAYATAQRRSTIRCKDIVGYISRCACNQVRTQSVQGQIDIQVWYDMVDGERTHTPLRTARPVSMCLDAEGVSCKHGNGNTDDALVPQQVLGREDGGCKQAVMVGMRGTHCDPRHSSPG